MSQPEILKSLNNGSSREGTKLMNLAQAARLVKDGDIVAIGGCLYSRTPWAMLLELLRVRRREMTLTRNLMCYEAELFLALGAASRLITSWVGIGLHWGIPKVFRELVESGEASYEEWSHLSLGLRYRAAAMGVPFLPTRSLLGSDLLGLVGATTMDCPYTGELVCLVPALVPDVALIHVHRADEHGNAQIDGPPYMDRELAAAAHRVILTAEEIVPEEAIVRGGEQTIVPHFLVDAVVEVPFGSFPHECYGLYEAWFDHFESYTQLVNEKGREGVDEYVRICVDAAGSFEGFLNNVGVEVLLGQRRKVAELMPK